MKEGHQAPHGENKCKQHDKNLTDSGTTTGCYTKDAIQILKKLCIDGNSSKILFILE